MVVRELACLKSQLQFRIQNLVLVSIQLKFVLGHLFFSLTTHLQVLNLFGILGMAPPTKGKHHQPIVMFPLESIQFLYRTKKLMDVGGIKLKKNWYWLLIQLLVLRWIQPMVVHLYLFILRILRSRTMQQLIQLLSGIGRSGMVIVSRGKHLLFSILMQVFLGPP